MKTKSELNKIAICTVLKHTRGLSFSEIISRSGPGLGSDLMELVQSGEIIKRSSDDGRESLYMLKE